MSTGTCCGNVGTPAPRGVRARAGVGWALHTEEAILKRDVDQKCEDVDHGQCLARVKQPPGDLNAPGSETSSPCLPAGAAGDAPRPAGEAASSWCTLRQRGCDRSILCFSFSLNACSLCFYLKLLGFSPCGADLTGRQFAAQWAGVARSALIHWNTSFLHFYLCQHKKVGFFPLPISHSSWNRQFCCCCRVTLIFCPVSSARWPKLCRLYLKWICLCTLFSLSYMLW